MNWNKTENSSFGDQRGLMWMKQVSLHPVPPRHDLGGGFPLLAISEWVLSSLMGLGSKRKMWSLENKSVPNLTAVHHPDVCGLMMGRVQSVITPVKGAGDSTRWGVSPRRVGSQHSSAGSLRPTCGIGCLKGLAAHLLRPYSRKCFSLKNHVKHGDTFIATKVFLMGSSASIFNWVTKPGSVWQGLLLTSISLAITSFTSMVLLKGVLGRINTY